MELLATTLRDIGFYFLAVWAGVLLAGGLLAGLAPLWRRWATRPPLRSGR